MKHAQIMLPIAAVLFSLGVASDGRAEDFTGFEARYIPRVLHDGKPVEADGQLTIEFHQICDFLYYRWNDARVLTLPDRVEDNHNTGIYHEKLDGTEGAVSYSVYNTTSVDGQVADGYAVNWHGTFERPVAMWAGTVEITREWRDIEATFRMPLPENVLTPAHAYASMLERLAAGETRFVQETSVIGLLDSLYPGSVVHAPVLVEVIDEKDSPFVDFELPETAGDLFGGRHWVVRISNASGSGALDGVKVLVYQVFENGLRGYIALETRHFKNLLQPVTARAVPPQGC